MNGKPLQSVALFFMYRTFGGGTTSYTVHLYEGFKRAGFNVSIYRVKERGEHFTRPFAKYDGVEYRNVTSREALKIARSMPSLMTAPCNSKFLEFDPKVIKKLMRAGMRITVHDPNEFEIYDHLSERPHRPFCIRPCMKKQFFKDAVFIPHPYVRAYPDNDTPSWRHREWKAVSIARVTFVKRTHIICEANKELPKEYRVVLRGAENRLYTRHVLGPRYGYKQGKTGFPLEWHASAREAARALYAVDFTHFPNDGGGSQYSFMEAWDAGTVNILHEDWLRYKGEMIDGKNCVAVKDARELSKVISGPYTNKMHAIVKRGHIELQRHDAADVAMEYYWEMTK